LEQGKIFFKCLDLKKQNPYTKAFFLSGYPFLINEYILYVNLFIDAMKA